MAPFWIQKDRKRWGCHSSSEQEKMEGSMNFYEQELKKLWEKAES